MSETGGLLGGDDLVTGEAVALDLPAATVAVRMVSGLLDMLVTLLLLVLLILVGEVATSTTDAALSAVVTVLTVAFIFVGVPTAVETVLRGRSLGKLAMGLRTVRDDAGPISFRHALVRSLVGFVEIWLMAGVPALFCSLVSAQGKRVGDVAAGTFVVRERFSMPRTQPVPMPARLAGWASRADIAPLDEGVALAARQFLQRATGLAPSSRAALGTDLTGRVLQRVSPAPPPGHHPEEVLAAVLAERRRRDEQRMQRDDQLRSRLRAAAGRAPTDAGGQPRRR